ncbi:N-acetyltransferase family protein [uncultured Desulfuromusa sp.]|uniref:GNAT family N-acetyltransferase n=1 Tax=uncultured Desulfuromusa sp. TaxID=219183 RepID=UPI002AA893D6|nr:N-acetyltransferase family protein [uncultured Desulfuromusa sp.]
MKFIDCNYSEHSQEILEILNESIINSTALYDYRPRTIESIKEWFDSKEAKHYPVIGVVDGNGVLMGFATFGAFRNWPAYKYAVEHSVYVHKDHHKKGVASKLMEHLIKKAETLQYHTIIGGIDVENTASIKLHEKFGFKHVGTLEQVGFKFGRWLDLAFYQLILQTPAEPKEG